MIRSRLAWLGPPFLAAACVSGFATPDGEAGADTEADAESAPGPVNPDVDDPPGECVDGTDCGWCSYCHDGRCEDNVGSCECAGNDPSLGFRCSPPWECSYDSECGIGEECVDEECVATFVPGEPPACPPTSFVTTSWSVESGSGIALADLDDDGVLELWMAGASVVRGLNPLNGETLVEVSVPWTLSDLHAIEREGSDRLVTVVDATAHQLMSAQWDGDTFSWVESAVIPDEHVTGVTTADLDGDGVAELIAGHGRTATVWDVEAVEPVVERNLSSRGAYPYSRMMTVTGPDASTRIFLSVDFDSRALVVTDLDGDVLEHPFSDLMLSNEVHVLETGPATDQGEPTLLATTIPEWGQSTEGGYTEFALGWFADDFSRPIAGVEGEIWRGTFADLMGGTEPELVLATGHWLSIVPFDARGVRCFATHMSDGRRDMAAADVDGDGRRDVIVLGADTVTIVRHAD